jgi:anti-sigma factor RsiW
MSIPDETLMAYADGELEPEQQAEVEAAMAADPKVAERVEQHQALRRKLNAAYDPVLLDTVPEALVASVRTSPAATPSAATAGAALDRGATITDLRRVRAARAAEAKEAAATARRAETPRLTWTWFEWGAVAASIAIGAVIASLAMRTPEASRIVTERGQLVAQGDLAQVLSTQLVVDQSVDAPIQIGVSFRSKAGSTCRTFTVRDQNVLGGLACRHASEWLVQVIAEAPPGTNSEGGYKPAGGSMPSAVVAAVENGIKGEALDSAGEAAARERGWQ